MPIKFYADINRGAGVRPDEELCLHQIEMFDGPGICTRPKGHPLDKMTDLHHKPEGSFHQEAFEGWIWDNHGRVG